MLPNKQFYKMQSWSGDCICFLIDVPINGTQGKHKDFAIKIKANSLLIPLNSTKMLTIDKKKDANSCV